VTTPLTTVPKVKGTAKHLSSLTEDEVLILIEDASMEVSELSVKDQYKEKMTRYLAAHYGSLNIRQTQSEEVGPIKRQFAAGSTGNAGELEQTVYGQEYLRLVRKYSPKKINLMVM